MYDFTDKELGQIYMLGRKTINKLKGYPPTAKMKRKKPHDPTSLPRHLKNTTDDAFWGKLVEATFFARSNSKGVERRLGTIHKYLGDYRKTQYYTKADVQRMLADKKMFRGKRKIQACIVNAKEFAEIIEDQKKRSGGGFAQFLIGYKPSDTEDGVALIVNELKTRFDRIGIAAANHFLLMSGFDVVKPDVNIMRTFHRIGLTDKANDPYETQVAAQRLGKAADVPVGWVDGFVNLGMQRGNEVCGKQPECDRCDLHVVCRYAIEQREA